MYIFWTKPVKMTVFPNELIYGNYLWNKLFKTDLQFTVFNFYGLHSLIVKFTDIFYSVA